MGGGFHIEHPNATSSCGCAAVSAHQTATQAQHKVEAAATADFDLDMNTARTELPWLKRCVLELHRAGSPRCFAARCFAHAKSSVCTGRNYGVEA